MAKWLKLYAIIHFPPNLTQPMSLHYLVKGRCSKCFPSTGFVTIILLRFGVKVKRTYYRDILAHTIQYDSVYLTCSKKLTGSQLSLPHGYRQTCAGCPETIFHFFMFQQDGTSAHQHATPSLSYRARETCEKRVVV